MTMHTYHVECSIDRTQRMRISECGTMAVSERVLATIAVCCWLCGDRSTP